MSEVGAADVLVLDIGGDTGALVVFAPEQLVGREVEITPAGHDHVHPMHNVVRRRQVGGRVLCAAVFPDVRAGTYLPYADGATVPRPFEVRGGAVTEIEWPLTG